MSHIITIHIQYNCHYNIYVYVCNIGANFILSLTYLAHSLASIHLITRPSRDRECHRVCSNYVTNLAFKKSTLFCLVPVQNILKHGHGMLATSKHSIILINPIKDAFNDKCFL